MFKDIPLSIVDQLLSIVVLKFKNEKCLASKRMVKSQDG